MSREAWKEWTKIIIHVRRKSCEKESLSPSGPMIKPKRKFHLMRFLWWIANFPFLCQPSPCLIFFMNPENDSIKMAHLIKCKKKEKKKFGQKLRNLSCYFCATQNWWKLFDSFQWSKTSFNSRLETEFETFWRKAFDL